MIHANRWTNTTRVRRLSTATGKTTAGRLLLLLATCFVARRTDAAEPYDLVLTGGRVVTLAADPPEVATAETDTIAVRGQRIAAIGRWSDIAPDVSDNTRQIRLSGQLVLPGFVEGHGHFLGLGQSKMILDLSTARNWSQIVAQVTAAAEKTPPGQWIVGRGWHQSKWDQPPRPMVEGNPTHNRLSQLTPRHPVLLTHASGHMCLVNRAAMKLAQLGRDTADPAGGQILRDPAGNPTGVLRENAMGLVRRYYQQAQQRRTPEQQAKDLQRAVHLAAQECVRYGVTSFHDAGVGFGTVDLYRRLAEQHQLPIRLWVMLNENNAALTRRGADYRLLGVADNHLTVRGIKRLIDGALGSHGAWLLAPYDDLPSSRGLNTLEVDDLRATARWAAEHQFQLCVHAIGDRANREVLDIYEATFAQHGNPADLRWRIEHAQHLHPVDIPRFAQLGVLASMQPVHCTSDAPFVIQRLGRRRARQGAYVWRKLIDSGAVVSFGTDVPVERVDPLAGIYAAVTRRTKSGDPFFPEQCLTRIEALNCYTVNGAYSGFQEADLGTLAVGKLADIAVLDRDILHCPLHEIRQARVEWTIVGGRVVYQAGQESPARLKGSQ